MVTILLELGGGGMGYTPLVLFAVNIKADIQGTWHFGLENSLKTRSCHSVITCLTSFPQNPTHIDHANYANHMHPSFFSNSRTHWSCSLRKSHTQFFSPETQSHWSRRLRQWHTIFSLQNLNHVNHINQMCPLQFQLTPITLKTLITEALFAHTIFLITYPIELISFWL